MESKVITLATSKGGVGKSTLARNIAAYWVNLGMKVLIVDADPQESLYSKHDINGPLKELTVIAEPEETVSETITENLGKYNFIIVDTGGFRNRTTVKALIVSDLAIIPLKPSVDDVKGAIATHQLIQELNKTPERIQNSIKYRMIMTMSQQNTVIAKHVRNELEGIGYLLLKAEMYNRVAYPEAGLKGLSPCITEPDGPASRDVSLIVKELNEAF